MNDENQPYESHVSCLWPLVTVLGAFLLVNLVQLVSIIKERQAVSQTTETAAQAIKRYKTVSDKLENLAKDLMRLSLTNNEAKEIVTQFNIQMNQPGGPAASPVKK
jgi:type II secretory pathway pseudopilin PulG